jgi:DNA (cytosine-5)-methyltransferase 1
MSEQSLRIGSLFSGIGGLELGLEWAGLGRTVYQVESDPFAREQLARHWPGVHQEHDVRTVDPYTLPACDVLCGGFPCQDLSVAGVGGSRLGLQGPSSGLWGHMARVVEAQRPTWVVVENVARGWRNWLPAVRADLRQLGYSSLPIPLEARVCGAPHIRQRLFVVCHADSFALRERKQRVTWGPPRGLPDQGQAEPLELGDHEGWDAQPPFLSVGNGLPAGMGANYWRALGNAVVPQVAETVGWVIRELIEAGAKASKED